MNRFKIVKPVTLEAKVSDNFPITHLNSPSIFESQSGLIGSVLRVEGISFEVTEPDVLNHQLFLLHQALIGLDSRFIVYVTTHRHKASRVLELLSKVVYSIRRRFCLVIPPKNNWC